MVSYMNTGVRIGADLLMDSIFREIDLSRDIYWVRGVGEYLPFRKCYFDVVLYMNVLDHMYNPIKSLK